jgi:hypothetical protein
MPGDLTGSISNFVPFRILMPPEPIEFYPKSVFSKDCSSI